MARTVLTLAFVLATVPLRAHPEIEDALNRLNALIAERPAEADLYVERGELYARHEDWVSAEANFLRATELSPEHPRLPVARGSLELATSRPAEARRFLDDALRLNPRDVEALILRARAQGALKQSRAAIADYDAALALLAHPSAELFLERATLLPPAEAVASLDEGIDRIGPAITLQLRAIALEESLGRTDAAVARIDRVAEQSERRESWLKRRGDLLARAGRMSEARAAYTEALARVADLPAWLRESPEVKRLVAELNRLSNS